MQLEIKSEYGDTNYCSDTEFIEANRGDFDEYELETVRDMTIFQALKFGGGAGVMFTVTRIG
jgi:hypothetical protein